MRRLSYGIIRFNQSDEKCTNNQKGGIAKLSLAQITMLIINLPDAQKNLSKEEFDKVLKLFGEFKKCKTKIDMDQALYLKMQKRL